MAGKAKVKYNQKGSGAKAVIPGADQVIGNLKLVRRGDPGSKWLPIEGQPIDSARFPILTEISSPSAGYAACGFYSEISEKLYFCVRGVMYVSSDGGATFQATSYEGENLHFPVEGKAMAESATEILIAGYRVVESLTGGGETIHNLVLRSTDGINFDVVELGTDASLHITSIAYGGGVFVVGFEGGAIKTSADGGLTWTARTSGTTSDIRCIAYGNGVFTVVGLDGLILTSPTGTTWTDRSIAEVTNHFYSVAAKSGLTIAVGSSNSVIKSTNGTTFSVVTGHGVTASESICYDSTNNIFVLGCGSGEVMTTADAATFDSVATYSEAGGNSVTGACHAAGLGKTFLSAPLDALDGAMIISSADGETWDMESFADFLAEYFVNDGETITGQWIRAED